MANHVTFEERRILYRLKKKGKSNTEIAELMGRHRSTICRELSRNTGQRGYRPKQAQHLAEERRLASRRPHKMDDPDVHEYVEQKLEKRGSPDQIAGRAERDFPRAPSRWLSRQTIYDWINDRRPAWQTLLRRGGRPPERRGKLSDVGRMHDLPPCLRRSRTFDNGKEFAEHHKLTRGLGLEVYFADPYVSWQRGTNENTNGLLRQFFPKRTDFTQLSHREVARVEQLLNERPRRRLDYRTPAEILAPRICRN